MRMHWYHMLFWITAFCLLAGQEKEAPAKVLPHNDYSGTIKYAGKRVHQVMRKHHLPAFAIAVVEDQDIIYTEVFGMADIENNVSATTKTIFKLWSVTKAFTAIEIFRSIETKCLPNRQASLFKPHQVRTGENPPA